VEKEIDSHRTIQKPTEVVMKKHTMIATVIAAVILNAAGYAQTTIQKDGCKSKIAKSNYLMGLRSDNAGLKESSLMQTAVIKTLYPDVNFEDVKNVADSLAVNGKTASIRYKAYLASNVLENPAWFAKRGYQASDDPDKFFSTVASQLQERILGSRTN
jgi:hypothetical protein